MKALLFAALSLFAVPLAAFLFAEHAQADRDADVLTIRLTEKGLLGAKTKKVKLRGISKQRDAFKETLGRYWHRHQTMRQSISA